ncbi:MAG TPA: selenium metabolism-associated LysR family transcriptional regulator [Bacillota bacterium]|nr:selenium metabolism-associated LysR family transcriptional regulator [Bacillota bacterium]
MDFQQLKIFLTVAALKSFSRAAEEMFISQPAVSVRIKGLEEELGAVLFDRSRARELTLTEAGREFLDYAQQMVNLQDEALARLARVEEGTAVAGPVQLGASTVPGIYMLPSRLVALKQIHPGIAVNLSIDDSARVLEKVLNYEVDLGFAGSQIQDERLQYYTFATDELVLITPPGYFQPAPDAASPEGLPPISLEQCLSANLILREKGSATRDFFETALAQKKISLLDFAGVIYVDSLEAIKNSVRHGLGISLVSRHSVEDYLLLRWVDGYRPEGLALTRRIYLVRHAGRVLSRAAKLTFKFFTAENTAFP